MARESLQKKLERVRPPRVQIKYEVQIGDAIEQKELPFVVGVLGNFAGKTKQEQPRVKDRKFVAIDRDNFDEVMGKMAPRVNFRVRNELTKDDSEIPVDLTFNSREDLRPEAVAKQFEPTRRLLDIRAKLSDLRSHMYTDEKFEELLRDILQSTEKVEALSRAMGKEPTKGGKSGKKE
ncbi:MAG: type VI secretion system contractile sheath small subunit [Alphaproteobacteria bacterium]